MGGREHAVTLSRVFRAPRELVWALVADTNRWDRASGLTPGTYGWREHEGRRRRGGTAREMGFEVEWIEPPYEWVEGSFVHGERRFLKGPVARGGFRARLEDVEGGTEVRATAYVAGEGAVVSVLSPILRTRFRRALRRYLASIDEVLSRAEKSADADQPPFVRVRRALAAGYDPVTSGARTPANVEVLEQRLGALRERGVAGAMADRLALLLRDRPDEEVAQIRPFELARIWDADRREVLRAFLYATLAGLVDLRWQINCPVCRVAAGVADSLEDVRNEVHCHACNIAYDVDFGRHIEAVFQCHPAIRRVDAEVYCASSPSFLPHVFGQLVMGPKETREEVVETPIGLLCCRTPDDGRSVDVDVPHPASLVEVTVHVDRLEATVSAPKGERGLLRVVNRTGRPVEVLIERGGWSADAVLGTVVASFPEFLDLFATEAPAAGVDLSIGNLALLFSDLTGSTALYERIGDARAFAIVEEHFRLMEQVVHRHRGAVVKTMGDAVMASFASAEDAVRAAIEMVAENDEAHGELGLGVKLGVHAGPCLAVRANDRLDFFGTTVNVAARLQAKAEAGHVVLTEELANDARVSAALGALPRRSFQTALKGIREEQRLAAVDAREPPEKLASEAS